VVEDHGGPRVGSCTVFSLLLVILEYTYIYHEKHNWFAVPEICLRPRTCCLEVVVYFLLLFAKVLGCFDKRLCTGKPLSKHFLGRH
jgi:hypothetical protein